MKYKFKYPKPKIKPNQLYTYNIKVGPEKVYDGDTILRAQVDLGFNVTMTMDLRLDRINAPEIRTRNKAEKAKGYESRDYLRQLIGNKENVTIYTVKLGSFKRWLCEIYVDGKNVNDLMVKNGYATEYKK